MYSTGVFATAAAAAAAATMAAMIKLATKNCCQNNRFA